MPSPRKAAAKKPSAKKKTSTAKRSRSPKASAPSGGPLMQVARKIGSTLGEVAVRTGIVKPGGSEPSGQ
jgi:hypothetical protein